ncbi:glycosyltransferase family 4 protein [Sphaerospermopsis sp. LEGE 08334]|uniref:glycosyltransferase family 4 protein n=1 Tax=Sphaerospermopsis sp. LEGE 08334 TaxID=1828651 RepID=UPI001881A73D|nr:glycosyltransferase family 4 protein [Sphaerospermopsis sp. LEGE 08334]MBE9055490.1 glycosyltransferase family 4 protein [Sphaerospermopsis sp. LEGE 08334]
MKIWHIGCSPTPKTVDGVNMTVWLVAREQALLGHQVTLVVEIPPDQAAKMAAEEAGFQLVYVPADTWRYNPQILTSLFNSDLPHIVHMHSVFLPKQATLARQLVKNKIPYVITPHAMSPQLLQRGWLKKSLYSWLVEKPRFYRASAISAVTPQEEKAIRFFVPDYQGIVHCLPNPVDSYLLEDHRWKGHVEIKKLVYLGRFDVLHKGIDKLIEIAGFLPQEVELHLYGSNDVKTSKWMERLQNNIPSNVYFHEPVFGFEKVNVLSEASLYIQMSRWEVFGISIAEAMYLGVPCAIADTLNLAELFNQHNLGLVLPSDSQEAAKCLTELMNQPVQMQHWSQSAKSYARTHFHPRKVALGYLNLYQEVLHI